MTTAAMAGLFVVVVAGAVLAPAAPTWAEDPTLLATTPSGLVPMEGETRLVVKGVRGVLAVNSGADGEIRFDSALKDDRRQELAISVWAESGSIRFEPPPDQSPTTRFLEITIPRGMSVKVQTSEAMVTIGEIDGPVEVAGDRLEVLLGSLGGSASVAVRGGKVVAQSVRQDLSVRGADLESELGTVLGRVAFDLTGGSIIVKNSSGDVDGTAEKTAVTLSGVLGTTRVSVKGGSLRASGLEKGGELRVAGATVALAQSKGDLTVTTDSEVRFNDTALSLHVNGSAGAVRGSGNAGPIDVTTSGDDVLMEKINGPVRVEGRGLNVQLSEVSGDIGVKAKDSQIAIKTAGANVEIRNDGGDVTLDGSVGSVAVVSARGNVRLSNLSASASVSADGDEVDVGWVSLGAGNDSVISNDGGGAVVRFLGLASGRVDATTHFGRIESLLPGVIVQEGNARASGTVGNGGRAAVKIDARGDIQLTNQAP